MTTIYSVGEDGNIARIHSHPANGLDPKHVIGGFAPSALPETQTETQDEDRPQPTDPEGPSHG